MKAVLLRKRDRFDLALLLYQPLRNGVSLGAAFASFLLTSRLRCEQHTTTPHIHHGLFTTTALASDFSNLDIYRFIYYRMDGFSAPGKGNLLLSSYYTLMKRPASYVGGLTSCPGISSFPCILANRPRGHFLLLVFTSFPLFSIYHGSISTVRSSRFFLGYILFLGYRLWVLPWSRWCWATKQGQGAMKQIRFLGPLPTHVDGKMRRLMMCWTLCRRRLMNLLDVWPYLLWAPLMIHVTLLCTVDMACSAIIYRHCFPTALACTAPH